MATAAGSLLLCIYGCGRPTVPGLEFCAACTWLYRFEIDKGHTELRRLLTAYALFDQWCAEHESER
jgi:hypothetical protein